VTIHDHECRIRDSHSLLPDGGDVALDVALEGDNASLEASLARLGSGWHGARVSSRTHRDRCVEGGPLDHHLGW
jgi:hypothetical protein